MMLNAIADFSRHQADVDFRAVREAGIVGVILKATEGRTYVDPTYGERRIQALNEGLLVGAYHFGTNADAADQVDHFMNIADLTDGTLAALDWEDSGKMTADGARAFVSLARYELRRWPFLYSGNTARDALGDREDPVLGRCPLWAARYGKEPVVPPTWANWTLWQYTDGKLGDGPYSVGGVGPCDRNKFRGTIMDLARIWAGPQVDENLAQAVDALESIAALAASLSPTLIEGPATDPKSPKRKFVLGHVWDVFTDSDRPMIQKYVEQAVSARQGSPTTKASISEAIKKLRGQGKIEERAAPRSLGRIARKMYGTSRQFSNGLEPLLPAECSVAVAGAK